MKRDGFSRLFRLIAARGGVAAADEGKSREEESNE
jgi:hypothetical protein